MTTLFRIHPAIGIARVGNSEEYYLGPESMAGSERDGLAGGLPLSVSDTDGTTTIKSSELRDADHALKRQAARFRIYAYQSPTDVTPCEITIGSTVMVGSEQKVVKDIVWSSHLANKKANCWIEDPRGMAAYDDGGFPDLRNKSFQGEPDPAADIRLQKLVIDAGPQAISGAQGGEVHFTRNAANHYVNDSGDIVGVDYPQQFPEYPSDAESSATIDTLGSLRVDKSGRLIVLGGFGKASGFDENADYDPNASLSESVNNDNWFDDTSDGPVTACVHFEDGDIAQVQGAGWIIVSDPSYAPQVRNVVSLWDEIYNTWLENFNLNPAIYHEGKLVHYQTDYQPFYDTDIKPILAAAELQRWATNLNDTGISAHAAVYANSTPTEMSRPDLVSFIRNPNQSADKQNSDPQNGTRMPLSLGDSEHDFLSLTKTQYFFIKQWSQHKIRDGEADFGDGVELDKNVLANCLGGRFSPGIEMTFIIRDPHLYHGIDDPSSAALSNAGPFRMNADILDYAAVTQSPALGVGYIPQRSNKVQPGDICKFMSIPWHTDYNSCATHGPVPNVKNSNMTYWSWPAQRPVAVYNYEDVAINDFELALQRFSVRGEGTSTDAMSEVGRYQDIIDFVDDWQDVGFVIQGRAIDEAGGVPAKAIDYFMEVESRFVKDENGVDVGIDESNRVIDAPIADNAFTAPPYPFPHKMGS
ncbi:L-lysine 6-oxidase [BD1-7 clade bacterium]|nr:L-lysine 6-oxidase [BD1-7 clade bacterium]